MMTPQELRCAAELLREQLPRTMLALPASYGQYRFWVSRCEELKSLATKLGAEAREREKTG